MENAGKCKEETERATSESTVHTWVHPARSLFSADRDRGRSAPRGLASSRGLSIEASAPGPTVRRWPCRAWDQAGSCHNCLAVSLAIYPQSAACFLSGCVACKRCSFLSRVIYSLSSVVSSSVYARKTFLPPELRCSSAPAAPFVSFLEEGNGFISTFNSLLPLGFIFFDVGVSVGVVPVFPGTVSGLTTD